MGTPVFQYRCHVVGECFHRGCSRQRSAVQVVKNMKGINEASRKIPDIIQTIDGMAFQANMQALNAARASRVQQPQTYSAVDCCSAHICA